MSVPHENRAKRDQLKPTLHEYLDSRFTMEFRRLEAVLMDKFEGDVEQVETVLDRLPEMDLKQWQKRVQIVPLKPTCDGVRGKSRSGSSLRRKRLSQQVTQCKGL